VNNYNSYYKKAHEYMNFSYQTSNRKFQFPNISYIMYHQGREFLNVLIVFSRPYLVRCAYATVLRLSPSVVCDVMYCG